MVSIAVLLLILAALPAAISSGGEAQMSVLAARNREALTLAAWEAEGCLARLRAAADDIFAHASRWELLENDLRRSFPEALRAHASLAPCATGVLFIASDSLLSVNSASAHALAWTFVGMGSTTAAAESLAAAVVDWRDEDDDAHPFGAERAWYRSHLMEPPRNGPIAHVRELAMVRGFATSFGLDDPELWSRLESVLSPERAAGRFEDRLRSPVSARHDGAAQPEGPPAWWFVRIVAGTPPLGVTLRARLVRTQDGFAARDVWSEP